MLARHLLIGPTGPVGPSNTVVVDGHVVFAFEPQVCIDPCPRRLERLDLATHSVRSGHVFSADTFLVALPHGLVVVSARAVAAGGNVAGGWVVSPVSPSTLQPRSTRQLRVGSSFGVEAAEEGTAAGGVWVGSGRQLEFVNARTGANLWTASSPLEILQLAVAPNRRRLYVLGAGGHRGTHVVVREYESRNGRLLASFSRRVGAGDSPVLTATDAGVWLVPGNARPELLTQAGLQPVHLSPGAVPAPGQGAYQDSVTDVGSFVLITSAEGTSCVSPTTGHVRARAPLPRAPTWTAAATMGGRLLVLGLHYPRQPHGGVVPSNVGVLTSVSVPPACFR